MQFFHVHAVLCFAVRVLCVLLLQAVPVCFPQLLPLCGLDALCISAITTKLMEEFDAGGGGHVGVFVGGGGAGGWALAGHQHTTRCQQRQCMHIHAGSLGCAHTHL
jgi:hypothetical protein